MIMAFFKLNIIYIYPSPAATAAGEELTRLALERSQSEKGKGLFYRAPLGVSVKISGVGDVNVYPFIPPG